MATNQTPGIHPGIQVPVPFPEYSAHAWRLSEALVHRGPIETVMGTFQPFWEHPGVLSWVLRTNEESSDEGTCLNATPLWGCEPDAESFVPACWINPSGEPMDDFDIEDGGFWVSRPLMDGPHDTESYVRRYRAHLKAYVERVDEQHTRRAAEAKARALKKQKIERETRPAEAVLSEAVNLLAYHVQQSYGSSDGGLASQHIQGDLEAALLDYVKAERQACIDLHMGLGS